jgi:hypothetical protein
MVSDELEHKGGSFFFVFFFSETVELQPTGKRLEPSLVSAGPCWNKSEMGPPPRVRCIVPKAEVGLAFGQLLETPLMKSIEKNFMLFADACSIIL